LDDQTPDEEQGDIVDALETRRMIEAILFASSRPLKLPEIEARLPTPGDIRPHLVAIEEAFCGCGFRLVQRGDSYQFQTAADLSFLLREEMEETRRLSRAAVETLSIIAYHQPVTRSEIEELRGVSLSRGTLDVLLEAEWIRPRGRKQVPGRPVLYATTDHFLTHFGLDGLEDLPGLAELRATGLLDPIDDALNRMLEQSQGAEEESQDDLPFDHPEGEQTA
jgi:segregation and condensation protein B